MEPLQLMIPTLFGLEALAADELRRLGLELSLIHITSCLGREDSTFFVRNMRGETRYA